MQVYRLQNEVELALADLNTAVSLSGGRGRAAEQAFTQRALIHRLHGRDEEAKADFLAAAKLGSKFAQKQVHTYIHTYIMIVCVCVSWYR